MRPWYLFRSLGGGPRPRPPSLPTSLFLCKVVEMKFVCSALLPIAVEAASMALQRTAVSRPSSSRYAVPLAFCPTAGRNSTLGLLSPSLVGGRADRPIFHLVLNWARNLYPYFANTERGEGPASPWLGAAMGEEATMRGGNFGIGSRTNCNCANHASPSVRRPSVRPSFRPSIGYLPSPLSPFAIHPLPIAKTTAACANSAGLSYAGRCGGGYLPTRLMPA